MVGLRMHCTDQYELILQKYNDLVLSADRTLSLIPCFGDHRLL